MRHLKIISTCLICLFFLQIPSAQVAVELEENNVLYLNVKNTIRIVTTNTLDSNLLLIPSRGEITKQKTENTYHWQICDKDTSIVFLSIFNKKTNELLEKKHYFLFNLPLPTPLIGNNNAHCIGFPTGLALIFTDFDYDIKAKVVSYDISFFYKNRDIFTLKNKGSRFNSSTQSSVQRCTIGDYFIIKNMAYSLDCSDMIWYLADELVYKIEVKK